MPWPATPYVPDVQAQEARTRFIAEWVAPALQVMKAAVPLLAGVELAVADAHETSALLFGSVDGVFREIVLVREPLVLQVFALSSHGRCWRRTLGKAAA